MKLKNLLTKAVDCLDSHSNGILTLIAIGGTCYAVYRALKDGPKCKKILEKLNTEGASNLKKAGAVVKTMGPTIAATAVSVGASAVNYKSTSETIRGLVDGIATANKAKDIYRDYIKNQEGGEEKVKEADRKVSNVSYSASKPKIQNTGHGDQLFHLEFTDDWFTSDVMFLKNAGINAKDHILSGSGPLPLNWFVRDIGVAPKPVNKGLRWTDETMLYHRSEEFLTFEPALTDTDQVYTIVHFSVNPEGERKRW